MKQKLSGFAAGVLATMLVLAIATPSFASNVAQTISAVFNSIGITLNDTPVASAGESYTLTDGTEVPYSILYKGTTYLPLRKVGELLGLGVEYNAVTKNAKLSTLETTTPAAPDTTTTPTDYSDWTPEEEAAYQEFKKLFSIGELKQQDPIGPYFTIRAIYDGNYESYKRLVETTSIQIFEKFIRKMMSDAISVTSETYSTFTIAMIIYHSNEELVYAGISSYSSDFGFYRFELEG